MACDWYMFYDICEALREDLSIYSRAVEFTHQLNELFEEEGIGWQMLHGQIVTRGAEEFEHAVAEAVAAVGAAGYQTPRLRSKRRDRV